MTVIKGRDDNDNNSCNVDNSISSRHELSLIEYCEENNEDVDDESDKLQ